MKTPLIAFLFGAVAALSVHAAEVQFYLGTYTQPGKSKGIYSGTLNTESGQLGPVKLAAEAVDPSYLALSPNGKYVYASLESRGAVEAFAIESGGRLTRLNQESAGGAGTCHVWVDPTGQVVLAANYDGGSVAAFRLEADGRLGKRSATVQLSGTGPNHERQEKSHAHAMYTGPGNRRAYACDLGSDKVWVFDFDPAQATLPAATPPFASVPAGGGPRHMAVHPQGKFAYVNNEMGLSVTAFTLDPASGVLAPFQTLSTLLPETPRAGVSTAEIYCHPTGRWLYVSNRGDDSISQFEIGGDGRLAFVAKTPAMVKVPRGFGIDPSGHWLIAAGQEDHRISVFKIDAASGRLSANGQSAEVGSPVCVLFAPAK